MFQHLLLAIDDSPSSPVALSFATALARRDRASVHVLHANRLLVGGRGFTELTDGEATALVDGAVLQLLEEGIDASGSVSRTSSFTIGQVIAEAAQARRCDAIVIGSARRVRRSRLAHPFGRGTRDQITRYSVLPVLTAPSPLQVPGGRRRDGGGTLGSADRPRTPVVR